jgi:hypothetical protein
LGLDLPTDEDVASRQKTGDKLAGNRGAPLTAMDGIAKLAAFATVQRRSWQFSRFKCARSMTSIELYCKTQLFKIEVKRFYFYFFLKKIN